MMTNFIIAVGLLVITIFCMHVVWDELVYQSNECIKYGGCANIP